MAAGDPIAVTNTLIAALNTDQALTFNAADATTNDAAQIFNYTPTGKNSKVLVGIKNGTGVLSYSIGAGDGVFKAAAAKTGTVAADTTDVIEIEVGRFKKSTGKVAITLTPASGTALKTNHACSVFVAELI